MNRFSRRALLLATLGLLWACGVETSVEHPDGGCQPQCQDRVCGPDSCGGSCQPGCSGDTYCDLESGRCLQHGCTPQCQGKQCGPDGCGGLCPPGCTDPQVCNQATGQCEDSGCIPDCAGRICGTDGCGGTCGPDCPAGFICNIIVGQCEELCQPECAGKECGPDGCGGWCPPGCGEDGLCNTYTGTCGPMEPDCSACPAVGGDLEAMRCAIELCDDTVYLGSQYESPTNADIQGTHAAVNHFGDPANDLAPLGNQSYSLMASGPAEGTAHSVDMGGDPLGQRDEFARSPLSISHDVMEWRIHLKAPPGAHGFRIHYVFLSEEYDEFIGSPFNDKFYIFLEAQSTNNGERTVINFTRCRNPDAYYDFICDPAEHSYCDEGQPYCYIAINTAFSECCWKRGCPEGTWTTSLAGTGYSCADSILSDTEAMGSSTGWLKTEWVIEPEEEFDIIFHIHDTSDHIYDSEVIIDKFLFLGSADPDTGPV